MSTLITRLNAELRGDKAIWAIIALLSIFSILAVYSSTGTLAYRYRGGDTEAFLLKHGVILLLGLGLIYSCHQPGGSLPATALRTATTVYTRLWG